MKLRPEAPLRPLVSADIPELARVTRANREFLAATDPLRPEEYFTDEGQERIALEKLHAAEQGLGFPLAITDEAGTLVGMLHLNNVVRGAFQFASVGYWVAQDRNSQGFASAAEAATLLTNPASQRVLTRNGFVQYGLAPEYLRIAGRWQDHLLFQVTFPS